MEFYFGIGFNMKMVYVFGGVGGGGEGNCAKRRHYKDKKFIKSKLSDFI